MARFTHPKELVSSWIHRRGIKGYFFYTGKNQARGENGPDPA